MKGRRIRFSRAELAFIEERCMLTRRDLHAAFVRAFRRADVTADHIKSLCTRKGWSGVPRKPWHRKDDALLRKLYPDTPSSTIARRLGRSIAALYGRAKLLGLSKSEAYLATPAAGRMAPGRYRGVVCRFQKGHAPANKGLRRPGWTAGRMKDTQFKKGQRGNKWQPIGSERVIEGYRYTKVADEPNVPYTANWKATHLIRWEQLHGPKPDGHVLKCLDGDTLNADPSNWDAIPRGILPRLNGIHGRGYDDAPPELKPIILATAKLEHAARQHTTKAERRRQRQGATA